VQASPFNGINHLGIVTADVDRAVRVWSERYRVGPWRVYRYDRHNMTAIVRGAPVAFEMRVGLCQVGPNCRLELLQPLDDLSPYAESLAAHGGADHIHHVRFDVPDFPETHGLLSELALDQPLDARFTGARADGPVTRAVYFDAVADVGFTLEIVEMKPGFELPEPEYVYPPADGSASGA
jgi:hypothetical protein